MSDLLNSAEMGDMDILRDIILNGEYTKHDLDDALLLAAENGRSKAVRYLLTMMSDEISVLDEALSLAAKEGETKIVKLLVEYGAKDLDNALVNAVQSQYEDVIEYLLEQGADAHVALEAAKRDYIPKLVPLIADVYGPSVALDLAARYGSMSGVEEALNAGAYNLEAAARTAGRHRHYNVEDKLLDELSNMMRSAYIE